MTPWTIAHQAPLSMGFSRQENWKGCHTLLLGFFLTQGLNTSLLCFLHWQGCSFTTSATWEAPYHIISSVQSLSPIPTLYNPMDCSTPGFPVHHQLLELAQTHVHWVSDAIQSSHPLSSPFPPAFNLSQHQGLFQWVSILHQVARVLELQFQHKSFQWIFRTDFL